MSQANMQLITNTAIALTSILRTLGYTCALCGELACYGFGISRIPKKVEALIILPPSKRGAWHSLDALNSQLVQQSQGPSYFFTSWDVVDNSNVLCYYDHTIQGSAERTCIIEMSYLDASTAHLIREVNSLPFVPISYVILRKLEEWATPLAKSSTFFRRAAADTIQALLQLLLMMDDLQSEPLDPHLYEISWERAQRFISEYTDSASTWKKLGFGPEPPPKPLVSDRSLTVPGVAVPPEPPQILRSPETFDVLEEPELPPISNPTRTQMVLMAAKDAVRLLYKCGWRSAIFGSLACFLYGNTRSPNDVDLLALLPPGSTVTAEELKQNLVVLDPYHFFTISSKDAQASYRVLYYRLTNNPAQTAKTSCKIDLLLPGVMNLPNFSPSRIHWDEGLPLVPFSLLLLQKLQAWDEHRRSKDPIKWQRQRTDMEDLDGLTALSVCTPLKHERPWSDETLFTSEFQRLSKQRVLTFCAAFPGSASSWSSLGFEIDNREGSSHLK
ncbi:hypothetical protein DXG01_007707 [Tephrocybe rancida]|nr:hypothetical protein DXG01_007707 [Tephrocybe rancida]